MKTRENRLFIKKIEIENCGRFYGKGHSIIFSDSPKKNITIVIGDSGRGKSTIHDLIYWCLYGVHKNYNSMENTDLDYGLINDDALEDLGLGQSTTGSVIIYLHDNSGEKYRLSRALKATLTRETDRVRFEERNNSRVSSGLEFSEDVVLVMKNTSETRIERDPTLIRSEINSSFPQDLSDFFLFDGENLVKFKHQASTSEFIKKGITKISGLEIVTAMSKHAKDTRSAIQKYIGGKTASAKPFRVIQDRLERQINGLDIELGKIQTEIKKKDALIEDTKRKIGQNKAGHRILIEQNRIKLDMKNANKELKHNNIEFKEFLFENIPILLARKSLLQSEKIFVQLEKDDKIPPSISRSAIDKILNSDPLKCVCGRRFKKSEEPDKPWAILNSIKGAIIADDVSQGLSIGRVLIDKMISGSETEKLNIKFDKFVQTRREKRRKIQECSVIHDDLEKQLIEVDHDDVDDLGKKKAELVLGRDSLVGDKRIKTDELEVLKQEKNKNDERLQSAIQREGKYESEQKKMKIASAVSKISSSLARNVEEILRIKTERATNTYFLQSAPEATSFDSVKISPSYEIKVVDRLGKVAKLSKGQAHILGLSYVAGIRDITNTRTFLIIDSPLHNISGRPRNEISSVFSQYLPGIQIVLLVTDTEYLHGDPHGAEPVRSLLKKNDSVWKEYVIDAVTVGNIHSRRIVEYKENA